MKTTWRLLAIVAALVRLPLLSGQAQQFEDVAEKRGLGWKGPTFSHYGMLAAWVDYNADGFDDLYFQPHSNSRGKSVLFWRNNKGQFQLVPTKEVAPDGYAHGAGDIHMASWGDFNNDGFPDLFIQNGGAAGSGTPHARHLLENRNGILRYVSKDYGIHGMYGSGRSALWFDYNNDRRLDLITADQAVKADHLTFPQLYRNDGDRFTNVSAVIGFQATAGANFAVASDLLGRGRAQIVLLGAETKAARAAERGLIADVFEVATGICKRFPNPPEDRWGRDAAVFDFDGDGRPEVIGTQFVQLWSMMTGKSSLPADIKAKGKPLLCYVWDTKANVFVEQAARRGLSEPLFARTILAGDFDNDMDVDLWIYEQAGSLVLPARYYENQGDGTFALVPRANGAQLRLLSPHADTDDEQGGIAATVGDYDNDGFLDIYCALMTRAEQKGKTQSPIQDTIVVPPALFHNRGNGNHWIEFNLVGTTSARDPVGAKVFVTTGGKRQLREFSSGNHRTGQDMRRLHFGLGKNTSIDAVEIHWPSSAVQKLSNVKADQILRVTETGDSR